MYRLEVVISERVKQEMRTDQLRIGRRTTAQAAHRTEGIKSIKASVTRMNRPPIVRCRVLCGGQHAELDFRERKSFYTISAKRKINARSSNTSRAQLFDRELTNIEMLEMSCPNPAGRPSCPNPATSSFACPMISQLKTFARLHS